MTPTTTPTTTPPPSPSVAPPPSHWAETLQDDSLKADASIRKFGNVTDLAKSYIELNKLVGRNRLPVPSGNDPAEYEPIYKALGRPDAPEGFENPEIPQGASITLDPNLDKEVRAAFHKLGLSKGQFKGVMGKFFGFLTKAQQSEQQAVQQQIDAGRNALIQKHGDKYKSVLEIARAGLNKFADGDQEFIARLEKSGFGNDPRFIEMMHNVGKTFVQEDPTNPGMVLSPELTAQQEIDRLRSDKDFMDALTRRDNPNHRQAVDRWTRAHKAAYPGQSELG